MYIFMKWNCDLSRQFAHCDAIRRFWLRVQCVSDGVLPQSTGRVTYVGPQGLSLTDHIVLTDNLTTSLANYYAANDDDVSAVNLSDHLPLCASFALSTLPMLASAPSHLTLRVAFYKATDSDLARYQHDVSARLAACQLPGLDISPVDLDQYYDGIISCCVTSSTLHIPSVGDAHGHRIIAGWTVNCAYAKAESIFWHRTWVAFGRPRNGDIADTMHQSCRLYHNKVKNLIHSQEYERLNSMADFLLSDGSRHF